MFFLKKFFRKISLMGIMIFPLLLSAQENISGILQNKETNEPVIGAVIQIDSTFNSAVSDVKGHFIISGIRGNNFPVTVTHISFQTEKILMTIGIEKTITLTPKTYLSEEVNISATRVDNRRAIAYSDISKSEIEKNNLGQDIPFLLNMTPSVVATSDGGTGVGYTGIRIRGSDATRINVTMNGIPVNDAESHQVYWVDLPDLASSVENMQVQRGIGSSTNGAGAFGGSINILTNKLSPEAYGNISSSAGSFNTFKNTVSFGSGLLSNSFALEGRLSKIISDGYVDRASSDLQSYYLSGGYYGKKNSLRIIILSGKENTYQAWYGVSQDSLKTNRTYNPAGEYYDSQGNVHYYENQTDNYRQDYYQLLYSHEFNKSLTGNFAMHYTKGKGYYEEYKPDEPFSDYNLSPLTIGDSTISNMDLVRQLWLSNHFYGLTWSVNYENKKININAGGSANRYTGKHYGELIASEIMMLQQYPTRYYSDNAEKNDVSAFVRGVYSPNETTNFFIDLQERIVDYSFYGFDDDYLNSHQNVHMNFFNPKAGLSYLISGKTQLYVSAAIGHKEPVRDDYVNSIPSQRPEVEYMVDYELGGRYNSGKLSLNINCYFMDYKNQLILNGKINDVGEYIRESVKNSYREGIEMEGTINLTSQINVQANITLSNNKIKLYREYVDDYDGGPQIINEYNNSDISFSPEIIGAGIIGFTPLKNFTIELTGKYVGKQFLDNTANETRKLDPYFINDLHLSYILNPGKIKEIAFRFSVNNILDKRYISNGYSYSGFSGGMRYDYNYYFPQAGRNWMAGIVVKV